MLPFENIKKGMRVTLLEPVIIPITVSDSESKYVHDFSGYGVPFIVEGMSYPFLILSSFNQNGEKVKQVVDFRLTVFGKVSRSYYNSYYKKSLISPLGVTVETVSSEKPANSPEDS